MNMKSRKQWAKVCDEANKSQVICSARIAADIICDIVESTNGWEFEHLVALFLNNKSNIVGSAVVGIGGFNGAQLAPAILFKKFFTTRGATAFIIGHNHPSGNITPSQQDVMFAKNLKSLSDQLQVRMLDCLVVTATDFTNIPTGDLL